MDRRDSIKSLLIGSITTGLVLKGCSPAEEQATLEAVKESSGYGRTPEEKKRDEALNNERFLTEYELGTIALLCDLILPANENFGSASDAAVPEFIEFMAKDLPRHQLHLRGGIMWLDNYANTQYALSFTACSVDQQKQVLDKIAYAAKEPDLEPGVRFFSLMRNLTLTGYYTTKMGLEDLGYKGNVVNVWDGVPEDVLKQHGMAYDEDWLRKCIDQNKRDEIAQWDDQGNLLN